MSTLTEYTKQAEAGVRNSPRRMQQLRLNH